MKILIDTGSAIDILYYKTFKEMGTVEKSLSPYLGRLEGFTNHQVESKGQIDLDVELGQFPHIIRSKITFIVIDVVSEYNAIIGIPAQATMGMIYLIPHQQVKFPTVTGVGCVVGNTHNFLEGVLKSKRKVEVDTSEEILRYSKSISISYPAPMMSVIKEVKYFTESTSLKSTP